jgi:insertion element IS1 protein InsB
MKCGALSKRKRTNVGYGMLLILKVVKYSLTYLSEEKSGPSKNLKMLELFKIQRFHTDHWGAYSRYIDPKKHIISKTFTQKIERKHLTLRTRIKRLTRKTICFSKSETMHDTVIGLY